MAETVADTRRLITKPQNLNDAYGPPSNFLEIDVSNPQTVGVGRGRFTTYEIRVKVRPSFPPTERLLWSWLSAADPGAQTLKRPRPPRRGPLLTRWGRLFHGRGPGQGQSSCRAFVQGLDGGL